LDIAGGLLAQPLDVADLLLNVTGDQARVVNAAALLGDLEGVGVADFDEAALYERI
jgi:hypothetical protein